MPAKSNLKKNCFLVPTTILLSRNQYKRNMALTGENWRFFFPGKSSIKLCLCSQVLTLGLLREPSHFWVIYVVKPSKGVLRGSARKMETLQVPKRSCVRVHSRL